MSIVEKPVLIVGGGIGGLAAALAISRSGYPVRLLEQSQEIAPIGYGIQLGPNVLPVLNALGVGELVSNASYLPTALELMDAYSGTQLGQIPLRDSEFKISYSHPYLAIHRADLHQILLNACSLHPKLELIEASLVTSFEQDESEVRVFCKDGRSFCGQALIAADGLRSKIRAQLYPGDEPNDTGYFAHRRIIPWSEAPKTLTKTRSVAMHTGSGLHVIYYPLRNETELNMVAVFKPTVTSSIPYKEQIDSAILNCTAEVRDVFAQMDLERRWGIADRTPIRQWSQGRVVLLGDSAHATLQSMAQGAGMALEDVLVLENCIREARGSWEIAFAKFTRTRFIRTARVQSQSRMLWQEFHCDGIEAAIRDEEWKEREASSFLQCLAWLWKPSAE